MIVADVMTSEIVTVPKTLSVADGLRIAHAHKIHHLLLTDQRRRLVGVACICDLRERPQYDPLESCITRALEVIWPQTSVRDAAQKFVEKHVGCFPVCDGEELVGIVTREDLRRAGADRNDLPGGFHCSFCGDTQHVRTLPNRPSFSACLECYDRMAPTAGGLYEEGIKG